LCGVIFSFGLCPGAYLFFFTEPPSLFDLFFVSCPNFPNKISSCQEELVIPSSIACSFPTPIVVILFPFIPSRLFTPPPNSYTFSADLYPYPPPPFSCWQFSLLPPSFLGPFFPWRGVLRPLLTPSPWSLSPLINVFSLALVLSPGTSFLTVFFRLVYSPPSTNE